MSNFKLSTRLTPSGSQPEAIKQLSNNIISDKKYQTLLGVTGSGKTFTIANVINKTQKPTIVIAHNKTLAAQLTQEFREFFPENAVEYFVSYYDYYQPEAYLPNSDTYIEKEATVNDEIDRLRNAASQAILTRKDVIVVASVSCIYGLGSPKIYEMSKLSFKLGDQFSNYEMMKDLLKLNFSRDETELKRGTFRIRGNNVEIMPADRELIYRIDLTGSRVNKIEVLHKINRNILEELDELSLFPLGHYVIPEATRQSALKEIEYDLESQLKKFNQEGKIIEAERLSRRTRYDIEMIREVGYCNGIENYSRYFDGRKAGEAPYTLLDYFKEHFGDDYLMVIDESHVTVPQLRAMHEGDKSRKQALVEYGFRLPAAKDNRPLKFDEFESRMPKTIFVSATPSNYEKEKSDGAIIEQVVRPTGLIDPEVIIRPTENQINDLLDEIKLRVDKNERTLVTTLTKKMAEDLTSYLKEKEIKVRYLHSDVETLERIEILSALRQGDFDVLIGVNLLREGLDLPEVSLVAILDADKEGFLRSETSLVQTIGRAARNVNGKVIMYGDVMTGSINRALAETNRRRKIQLKYNQDHNITPQSIKKEIKSITAGMKMVELDPIEKDLSKTDIQNLIKEKEVNMKKAAEEMRFEEAAILRDQTIELKKAAGFFKKIR
jgi:excinuclease ABC subunit B